MSDKETKVNTGMPDTEVKVKTATKYESKCQPLAMKSYKCLEVTGGNRASCQEMFDEYKKCRTEEHRAIVDERRRNNTYL